MTTFPARWLAVVAFGFWPFAAHAASHYIRGQAVGSANTGASWANAWTNFSSVTWTRGDTYYWAGGTNVGDVSITVAESGTTQVTLKKANAADNSGDAGWTSTFESAQAVLQGTLNINNSYITINGVTGTNRIGSGGPHGFGYGIKVYQPVLGGGNAIINLADNKVFFTMGYVQCHGPGFGYSVGVSGFKQNSSSGLVKGHRLHNLYFHDLSQNGFVFVNVLGTSFSDYGLLFEDILLEDCGYNTLGQHGQGIQGGSGAAGSSNAFWTLRNFVFHNVVGTAAMAWLGYSTNSDIRIYNGVFWNTNQSFNEPAGGVWTNWTTLQDASSPGEIYVSSTAASSTRFEVMNNTFYQISRATVYFADTVTNGNRVVNNLFNTNHFNLTHVGLAQSSHNAYWNCLPIISSGVFGAPWNEVGQRNETAEPCVNPVAGDFRLVATALSAGNGTNLSGIFTTDINGATRSQWDIGAYAFAPVPVAASVIGGKVVAAGGGVAR